MSRFLIVDDDPRILLLLAEQIKTFFPDATIIQADTGEDALDKVEQQTPDLIITDLSLPGIDGFDVCRTIRNRETTKRIPIIIASGFLEESKTRIKGLKDGADAFLRKPFDVGELVALIQSLLRISQTETLSLTAQLKAQHLLDTAGVMFTVLNPLGELELINTKGCQILGYEEEELIGKNWFDVVLPMDERSRVKKVFTQIVRGEIEQVEYYENRILTRTGEERLIAFHNAMITDDHGTITGVLSSGEDITEREAAQAANLESEERFRTIFDFSPDALYLNDLKGVFYDGNLAAEKVTGYKKEELIGKSFLTLKLLPPGQILKASKLLAQNLLGRATGPDAFTLTRKDGTEVEVEVQTFPVKLQNRKLVLGSARDITKRREAEHRMEEALELEENANRVKTLFLENISHEIRTPLNSILGFAEILNERLHEKLSEVEQFMLSNLKISGERLMRTVHEILDIAQFESGQLEIHPKNVALDQIVRDVVQEYHDMAKSKGLELRVKDHSDSVKLYIDEDTMRKALSHLVDNAIKYTETGFVELQLYQEAGNLCLVIKDTGIGMSSEYLENLYEAFSQESEGYTKKFQGLGVGLALAKRYLDTNNVQIHVESGQNVGTTFTLTHALTEKYKEDSIVSKPHDVGEGVISQVMQDQSTILVVEDDLLFQNLLEYHLSETYQVCFAQTVAEAKQRLEEQPVHLVLLDLSLIGGEDGLKLVHYMRNHRSYKKIPVIAVTAHAFSRDEQNVMQAGCNDFVTKPVKQSTLLERIEKFLPSSDS